MITVENKSTGIKITEERNANYADLIAIVVNKPLKEVIDIKSMRQKLNFLRQCEEAKETITFTKEQFNELAKEIALSQWGVVSRDILDFVDYIAELANPVIK